MTNEFKEIFIKSTIDGSLEPSLFYESEESGKRPLLVFLHTWSHGRENQMKRLGYAKRRGFHMLLPEFRGSNTLKNPRIVEACGSRLAKQDIKDAIDYCIEHFEVDTDNIFVIGLSGGGHMSLMMAGEWPELFRAVTAFVPITDLDLWREQSEGYRKHLDAIAAGGRETLAERSPVSYIDNIARANVKIFAGKYDNVVPFRQTLDFYNTVLDRHPEARIFVDIFDGGHEYVEALADEWITSQMGESNAIEVTG